MSRVVLPSKLANEEKRYVLDFTGELLVGETILEASAAMTIYSGSATPFTSTTIVGTTTIVGPRVYVIVSGGAAGILYFFVLSVRTSGGQMLDKEGFLSVIPSTS